MNIRFARRTRQAHCAVFTFFAALATACAQTVWVPAPVIPAELPAPPAETPATNRVDGAPPPPVTPREPQLRWGMVTFHPRAAYQFTYGDGIQSAPGQTRKTAIHQVTPGIGFDIGRHWKLDYDPTALFYSDSHFQDTVNHFIRLAGDTEYNDWRLRLAQDVALTSDPQIQTGSQTDQETYLTTFGANWEINADTSLEFGLNQYFRVLGDFTNSVGSSRNWSTLDWLNHQWGPNLGAAVGAGFGYEAVDSGSDMTYEQFQGRVTWRVAQKVNLSLNGGVELRQFVDSDEDDLFSPVFDVTLDYRPFKVTTLSLNGGHHVNASYFENLVTESTSIYANLSQRLFKRLYLGVSAGYTHAAYRVSGTVTPGDPNDGRVDDYNYIGVSLSTAFLKRGTASVSYSASKNSSNRTGFGYTSDQIGFQLGFRY